MITTPLIKLTDTIGGLTQTLPAEDRSVEIGEVEMERTGRTSSGKLVSDILSSKVRFRINFATIDAAIVNQLIALRQSNNDLTMLFQEAYGSEVDTYIVRIVAPIVRTRLLAINGGVYGDVTVEIEEV